MFFLYFVMLLAASCLGTPTPQEKHRLERRFDGQATWFIPDTGACGDTNSETDYIVAVNSDQYQGGESCHKMVYIQNESNGKSVRAKVTDECPPCDYGSLDLSASVFQELGDLDTGVLPISWHYE